MSDDLVDLEQVNAMRYSLMRWGKANFRSFRWRETRDPYHILIAEILLHRTQVKQVVPLYNQLIRSYPDISALILASKDSLQQLLYSLGLRWRIDLLYDMAQEIRTRFDSEIPQNRDDLLSLPGISEYIASAVRCFAWNQPEILVDTNTVRIIGRYMNWPVKDSSRRDPRFRQALQMMVDPNEPRVTNYALLDLAHLICLKRKSPLCLECPIKPWCYIGLITGGNA